MKITRRRVIAGAGVAGASVLSVSAYSLMPGGVRRRTLEIIAAVYGEDIAAQPAALEFAAAYDKFVRDKGLTGYAVNAYYRLGLSQAFSGDIVENRIRESVIRKFASSTNVIRAAETNEPLQFVALFQPYLNPCANQLSAQHVDWTGPA